MKKIFLTFCLIFTGLLAGAQSRENMFPKAARYFIKNGAQIKYEQIDSVLTSWKGMFQLEHQGDRIYLSPATGADQKALDELSAKTSTLLNQPAPDFSVTDMSGKKYTLAGLRGKVIVLNFWFTTCAPCIAEMPGLNAIRKA